jgi:hypothetical protein
MWRVSLLMRIVDAPQQRTRCSVATSQFGHVSGAIGGKHPLSDDPKVTSAPFT